MTNNLKIIFLGTPEFSSIILEKMIAAGYRPTTVITAPDKPVGRKQILTPPPVKIRILNLESRIKNKIKIIQPDKIENLKSEILNLKPDLVVLAAYGQILPKEILDIPKYGCLNVHPSLLPKYRGASPIQAAILNGDQETGATVMLMDEKMDHGPIVAQQRLEIRNPKSEILNKSQIPNSKINAVELTRILAKLGAKLLIETIPKWIKGEIKTQPQDHSEATYTKMIKKENGKIDWRKSAEEIERMVRAYWPWPGTYTRIMNHESRIMNLKIIKADILKIDHQKEPGMVFLVPSKVEGLIHSTSSVSTLSKTEGLIENKKLAVTSGQDALILKEVQLEGKRSMTAQEFLNGHREIINSVLS